MEDPEPKKTPFASLPKPPPSESSKTPNSQASVSKPVFNFGSATPAAPKSSAPTASGQQPAPSTDFSKSSPFSKPTNHVQESSQPSLFQPKIQSATPSQTGTHKNPFQFSQASELPKAPQPSIPKQPVTSFQDPRPRQEESGSSSFQTPQISQSFQSSRPDMSTLTSPSKPAQNNDVVEARKLRDLQHALAQHISSLDPENLHEDWTATMQYYLSERQKIQSPSEGGGNATEARTSSKKLNADTTARSSSITQISTPSTLIKPVQQPQSTPNAFTPTMFGGKRKAEDEEQENSRGEASGKKARTDTPSTLQTTTATAFSPEKPLSATASIFDNILQKPDTPNATVQKSADSSSKGPVTQAPKFDGFKPSAPSPSSAPIFSFSKPVGNDTLASSNSSNVSIPEFGTGKTDFMSAFAAKVEKQADKDKEKRKAEEYDSDEDNEEEWERQDRERQEAKRQQLMKDSKKVLKNVNGQFVFVDPDEPTVASSTTTLDASNPVSSSAPAPSSNPFKTASVFASAQPSAHIDFAANNPFAHLTNVKSHTGQQSLPPTSQAGADPKSDSDEDEDVNGTTPSQDQENQPPEPVRPVFPSTPIKAGGLFDRIGKNSDGSLARDDQAEKSQSAVNPFGFAQASYGKPDTEAPANVFSDSVSSAVDKTWKPESPIKFGNADSKVSGSTTPNGSPAKPLFQFTNTPKFPAAAGDESEKPAATTTPKFNFGGQSSVPSTAPPKFSFGNSMFSQPSSTTAPGTEKKAQNDRPFAGLMGNRETSPSTSSLFAPLKKDTATSAVGFQFGGPSTSSLAPTLADTVSQNQSRATTPGATTDAEGSNAATDNEEETQSNEPQLKDLTALTPEERETEEVLFEQKSRCNQFIRKDQNDSNDNGSPWVNKGIGIIRLLKNKQTSSPRILMRSDPRGVVMLNYGLIKDKGMYAAMGPKSVKMVFAEEGGALVTFTATFGQADIAKDLLSAIHGALG